MTDAISVLRGLCQDSKARDEELRHAFAELEDALIAATADAETSASSDNCSLETYGDDEAIYGHLFFSGSLLRVAYRSTEEDATDALDGNLGDRSFSIAKPQECRAVWLRALAAPTVVESLVTSLASHARESIVAATGGVKVLATAANLPIRDLESALVTAAERLDYQVVIADWRRAQSALGVDPAEAANKACRLLESLCKHILQTKGQTPPAVPTLQKLFKAAAKSVTLSPDQQSSNDLRAIASGVFAIAHGVGSLRNNASTAHGGASNRYEVTFSEARLAVNSAGAVATFLMEALLPRE